MKSLKDSIGCTEWQMQFIARGIQSVTLRWWERACIKGLVVWIAGLFLLLLESSLVMNLKRTQCRPFQPKHSFKFICGIASSFQTPQRQAKESYRLQWVLNKAISCLFSQLGYLLYLQHIALGIIHSHSSYEITFEITRGCFGPGKRYLK